MLKVGLGAGETEVVGAVGGPSVVFAVAGKGKMRAEGTEREVRAGWVFFVGAAVELVLEADGEEGEGLEVYWAFAE